MSFKERRGGGEGSKRREHRGERSVFFLTSTTTLSPMRLLNNEKNSYGDERVSVRKRSGARDTHHSVMFL